MVQHSGPDDDSAAYVKARRSGDPDPWSAQGRRAAQRLLEVRELEAPAEVAEALGVQRVVVRRRLMLFDDVPVELTDSYYPLTIAAGTALAEERKVRGGAVTLLAELGHVAHEVFEDVSARPVSGEQASALGLPASSTALVLARVSRDNNGRPFEMSHMVMRPEGRHLRYRWVVE
ncbi:UTRA domain-containing protein [Nocardiopsis oceani]